MLSNSFLSVRVLPMSLYEAFCCTQKRLWHERLKSQCSQSELYKASLRGELIGNVTGQSRTISQLFNCVLVGNSCLHIRRTFSFYYLLISLLMFYDILNAYLFLRVLCITMILNILYFVVYNKQYLSIYLEQLMVELKLIYRK